MIVFVKSLKQIWIGIVLSLVVTALFWSILNKLRSRLIPVDEKEPKGMKSFGDILMYLLSILSSEGEDIFLYLEIPCTI